MSNILNNFLDDESGATAIEYGLVAALLAVGISASVTALNTQVTTTFNSVATSIQTANQ